MLDILNLESLEPLARARLDPMLYDYIAGGAADEWTLAENRAAWIRLQLLPRMLRGVADPLARDDRARHAGLVPGARGADGIPRAVSRRGGGGDGARHGGGGHDLLREHGVERAASRRSRARRAGRGGFSSTSIATARSRASW